MFITKKVKPTGKVYKFNDYPFNMMSWKAANYIEAQFNVGNPKEGDVIQTEKHKYIITHVETTGPIDWLYVNPIGESEC